MAPTAMDLYERVGRLEARAALADLVARYCAAVDDRNFSALAALFTADGSFGHRGSGQVIGTDAIYAFYVERLRAITYSFHYPHTHTVSFPEPGHAIGEVSAHAEMGRKDAPPLRAAIRYSDEYQLSDAGWQFARREVRFFYFASADEIDSGRMGDLRNRWPGSPRQADLPAR